MKRASKKTVDRLHELTIRHHAALSEKENYVNALKLNNNKPDIWRVERPSLKGLTMSPKEASIIFKSNIKECDKIIKQVEERIYKETHRVEGYPGWTIKVTAILGLLVGFATAFIAFLK